MELRVDKLDIGLYPKFDRPYICFDASKKSILAGCRLLIGFNVPLKGYYTGQLLTVVTQDGNHSVYVIAFAIM